MAGNSNLQQILTIDEVNVLIGFSGQRRDDVHVNRFLLNATKTLGTQEIPVQRRTHKYFSALSTYQFVVPVFNLAVMDELRRSFMTVVQQSLYFDEELTRNRESKTSLLVYPRMPDSEQHIRVCAEMLGSEQISTLSQYHRRIDQLLRHYSAQLRNGNDYSFKAHLGFTAVLMCARLFGYHVNGDYAGLEKRLNEKAVFCITAPLGTF